MLSLLKKTQTSTPEERARPKIFFRIREEENLHLTARSFVVGAIGARKQTNWLLPWE
jgi:hypothetical protein